LNSRIDLGRIAGIPIVLDIFFIIVMLAFTSRYFLSGNTQLMSAGLIIVAGLAFSVLLHELGHAFAGRLFKVDTQFIELNGLGGACHFETSLPRSVFARTVIYLAGPAANLLLWLVFGWLADIEAIQSRYMLVSALSVLAWANWYLMAFNLLPAYPLDGGKTLEAWLGAILGYAWGVRVVACLGLLVAAGIAYVALPSLSIFMLLLAVLIGIANWAALMSVGGISGRR